MNKSESIKELCIALNKFQCEANNPKNSETNSFFKSKYAPLNEVINAAKPIWTKCGLTVFQNVSGTGELSTVTTLITHISGEWIESDALTLSNQDNKGVSNAQAAGIAITYARRYQLSAMLGLASEDDTDGNNYNQQNTSKSSQNTPQSKVNTKGTNGKLSNEEVAKAVAIGKNKGITLEAIKKTIFKDYGKTDIADLTKEQYDELCTRLENAGGK